MSDRTEPSRVPGSGAGGAGSTPLAGRDVRHRRFNVRPVNLLLLVPLVGVLVPQFYNRRSPEWGGMPFFYWYELVWIPVSVLFTYYVYRSTRGQR